MWPTLGGGRGREKGQENRNIPPTCAQLCHGAAESCAKRACCVVFETAQAVFSRILWPPMSSRMRSVVALAACYTRCSGFMGFNKVCWEGSNCSGNSSVGSGMIQLTRREKNIACCRLPLSCPLYQLRSLDTHVYPIEQQYGVQCILAPACVTGLPACCIYTLW